MRGRADGRRVREFDRERGSRVAVLPFVLSAGNPDRDRRPRSRGGRMAKGARARVCGRRSVRGRPGTRRRGSGRVAPYVRRAHVRRFGRQNARGGRRADAMRRGAQRRAFAGPGRCRIRSLFLSGYALPHGLPRAVRSRAAGAGARQSAGPGTGERRESEDSHPRTARGSARAFGDESGCDGMGCDDRGSGSGPTRRDRSGRLGCAAVDQAGLVPGASAVPGPARAAVPPRPPTPRTASSLPAITAVSPSASISSAWSCRRSRRTASG